MEDEKKYKVKFLQNNIFEVYENKNYYYHKDEDWESVYQGTLSDCEAFIRLNENGYM
jgi:hypothetical protein